MPKTKPKTPLRAYCEQRGISVDDIAKRARVHPSTARNWMNGNRQIEATDVRMREEQLGIPRAILRPDLYA